MTQTRDTEPAPAWTSGHAPVLVILPSVINAGAELQAILQIRGLAGRGVPVRLMVLSRSVDATLLARAGLAPEAVCRLRNPDSTLGQRFLAYLWRDLPRAAGFARRTGAATVIAHMQPAHLFGRLLWLALALTGRRVRLIHYHHTPERRLFPLDTRAKRIFAAANERLGRLADHAHWHVSEQVRRDMARGFTRRDAVIHNTCDMDSPGDAEAARRLVAPLKRREDTWLVLMPGRLKRSKGHTLFLEALARLCREAAIPPEALQVLIAGEGDQRPRIEAEIARLDLGDRVTLAGEVAPQVLLALYPLADLVVVPSLDEGFGIVAIEAMSRGTLVLASDAGGLAEVVRDGETGMTFPAGDTAALTAQLARAWHRRAAPPIDRAAAASDCRARFGPAAHLDRLMELLAG